MKGEIEKKNQFSKRKRKKIKGMSIKIYIKTKIIFWLKGKLKKKITFTKGARKKNQNQNNEDKIQKHNIINLDWRMKLKTNKTLTKEPRKKIRNQNNKD